MPLHFFVPTPPLGPLLAHCLSQGSGRTYVHTFGHFVVILHTATRQFMTIKIGPICQLGRLAHVFRRLFGNGCARRFLPRAALGNDAKIGSSSQRFKVDTDTPRRSAAPSKCPEAIPMATVICFAHRSGLRVRSAFRCSSKWLMSPPGPNASFAGSKKRAHDLPSSQRSSQSALVLFQRRVPRLR